MEVHYLSPWVPREWIQAHGHEARGLWSKLDEVTQGNPAGVCGFARSALDWLRGHPEAAAVIPASCDQLRRSFDSLAESRRERLFLFNLPATWQTGTARRLYQYELERLGWFLVDLGGHVPSRRDLSDAIAVHDRARDELRSRIATGTLRARELAEAFARFHWDGMVAHEKATGHEVLPGVPLVLLGGPLHLRHQGILGAIEQAGGRVVIYGLEPGETSLLPTFLAPADAQPMSHWMADHYGNHLVDVFQRPNHRLYDWLKKRLARTPARGIVLWHFYSCDLWRAEAQTLREKTGLPVLLLEATEAGSHAGTREFGRIQAFMEMLR
jgi:benzoyl-CoA reductase/2-hydroxyglutaryl-CoA dehydratase subunit BcrC/BadD/HgdB